MIEATDAGVAHWLNIMFGMPIRWAHPDHVRKVLASQTQTPNDPMITPANKVGIPGIAFFRTDVLEKFKTPPLAQLGLTKGTNTDGDFYNSKLVPIEASYSIFFITRNMSERNDFERKLALNIARHKAVMGQVKGKNSENVDQVINVPFNLSSQDLGCTYDYEINSKTGDILWYSLRRTVTVGSFWLETSLINHIEEINVQYQEMIKGDPITFQNLDFITILPTNHGSGRPIVP